METSNPMRYPWRKVRCRQVSSDRQRYQCHPHHPNLTRYRSLPHASYCCKIGQWNVEPIVNRVAGHWMENMRRTASGQRSPERMLAQSFTTAVPVGKTSPGRNLRDLRDNFIVFNILQIRTRIRCVCTLVSNGSVPYQFVSRDAFRARRLELIDRNFFFTSLVNY